MGLVGGRTITRCDRCGLFWTLSPEGVQERLRYYRETYWDDFKEEQAGTARENIFSHALSRIESQVAPPGIMVDIGCGPGAFLQLSLGRGWDARGFDPSRSAVAQACAKGLNVVECVWPPGPLPNADVDVVTMVNVLDHLPNPIEALEEVWRVLKVGGLLYLRVPNGPVHYRLARLLSLCGLGHLPVFHLFGFGAKSFRHHLPRIGFTMIDIRTAPPSQLDSYGKTCQTENTLRAILKQSDRGLYVLMKRFGVDRLPYGLSIEVIARKHQGSQQEIHA